MCMYVQLVFLLVSSVSFTIAYHSLSPAKILQTIFYTILVDWLLVGVVVSTICWLDPSLTFFFFFAEFAQSKSKSF